ncbi:MAG: DNA translocase FtsK 4TM domain-containing protein [Candidatus Moranbacteria bacterium]|nr:DNA translocase FtsK 4TM domain-containing protein [Candidatus Moranbacteria bacterium]
MGRKKKNVEVIEEEEESLGLFSFLHGDAKRSIVAVILFALSILFVLGFFESAGLLGHFFNSILGKALGWGKWIFPPVLMTASVFLLKRRQSSLAEFLKLTGLAVAFVSLLGFFHLYLDGDLLKAAEAGEGGGYIGFAIAHTLRQFTGTVAGTIILVALILTGLITAFNLSLIHFFERMQARMKQNREVDESEGGYDEEESVLDLDDMIPKEMSLKMSSGEVVSSEDAAPMHTEEAVLQAENIQHLKFSGEDTQEDEEDEEDEEDVPYIARPKQRKRQAPKRHWVLPPLELLEAETAKAKGIKNEQSAFIIQKTLKHFGIDVELGEVQTGPTVTQYTFRPTAGIKLSRITALNNDLALALAAQSIRIEAPIPGKSLVGIEVPNQTSAVVRLKNVLLGQAFTKRDGNMMLVLGQDVTGEYVLGDLRKMPHLLVAGATNSGKSVCVNTLLLSLLYQNSPDDLKLILVDPKRVELSLYNKIPHLLTDVIVENKKVVNVLRWAVSEMERRYKVLQETGSQNLASYKQKFDNGEKRVVVNPETNKSSEEDLEKLPYIVIVIDEMADLVMAHGKDVEGLIVRLAQMSRAVGIHLILATQRPSVEVLTGLIKANITTRIAFQVATQIDSRTILDQGGAEKLLGRGDMLYLSTGSSQPKRLQGVFISEEEVKNVVDFLKKQKLGDGNEEDLFEDIAGSGAKSRSESGLGYAPQEGGMHFSIDDDGIEGDRSSEDDLYNEAKELVIAAGKASASLLQRRLRVGYSRAARILDLLEDDGVIGPSDGAKPREVYADGGGRSASQGKAGDEEEGEDDPLYEQEKRDKWQM